jgi:hypothetical protein
MAAPFQQGRTAYQDFRGRLSPTALRNPVGAAFEAAFGSAEDAALDQLAQSVKARLPGVAAADALRWTGGDRQIDRGPTETDAAYAARLQGAFETWPWAGTARGLLRALYDAGYPNTALVQQLGGFFILDPGGTNQLLWSQDLRNALWVSAGGAGGTATGLVTAPDGSLTANVVTATTTPNTGVGQSVSGLAAGAYTFSIWLRAQSGTENVFLDLFDSTASSGIRAVAVTVTTAWQRFSITGLLPAGHTLFSDIKLALAGHFVEAWGAQTEPGYFATKYTPTTTATASHAADPSSLVTAASLRFLFDDKTPGTAPAQWTPSASLPAGQLVVPNPQNGFFYGTTNPITTGSSQPTWPTTPGATVVDGNGTWSCRGRDFWSRFAVLFVTPFPASWSGTPPANGSDEVARIRRLVQLWKPAHATPFGLVALSVQLWDWPNPTATTWDTWRPTWDSNTTPAPTYWTP